MEFTALDNPTSPFNSSVNAGAAEAIGLNANITNACLTSNANGKKE